MTADIAINESHVSDNPSSVAMAARCGKWTLVTLEMDGMARVFYITLSRHNTVNLPQSIYYELKLFV